MVPQFWFVQVWVLWSELASLQPSHFDMSDPSEKRRSARDGDGRGGGTGAGAPGGPLIMSRYISPLTSVSQFRAASLDVLNDLHSLVSNSFIQADDSNLFVHDLKILTDSQLVEQALAEALQPTGDGRAASVEVVSCYPHSSSIQPTHSFQCRNQNYSAADAFGLGFQSPFDGLTSNSPESKGGQASGLENMSLLDVDLNVDELLQINAESTGKGSTQRDLALGGSDLLPSVHEELRELSRFLDEDSQTKPPKGKQNLLPDIQSVELPALKRNAGKSCSVETGTCRSSDVAVTDSCEDENTSTFSLLEKELGKWVSPLESENQSEMRIGLQVNRRQKEREACPIDHTADQACPSNTRELQQKKKRGRRFDVLERGPALEVDARKEAAVARLREQREWAKSQCSLHALKAEKENEGINTSLGNLQNIQALRFFTSFLKTPTEITSGKLPELVDPSEVILCVDYCGDMRKKTVTQEFIVLGSQPLTALRDQFYCLTNELAQKAGVAVPSGYFFIENTFYNDMRDEMSKNYVTPILNWMTHGDEAKQKWKALGASAIRRRQRVGLASSESETIESFPEFKQGDMHSTCFLDLQIKLGADYLYVHQGDCKHFFVIRDLRMIHIADVQNVSAYPLLRFPPALKHRKCSICSIYRAKKVTVADKLAPASPCFFCENCYYLLHYSKDGSLMYDDFKVYDYFHE